jgi:hypothetical protein
LPTGSFLSTPLSRILPFTPLTKRTGHYTPNNPLGNINLSLVTTLTQAVINGSRVVNRPGFVFIVSPIIKLFKFPFGIGAHGDEIM